MTNTRTPHKHAEVIRAYADGHDVQMCSAGSWVDIKYPVFAEEYQFRVKPEPKTHKYRVALFSDGKNVWTISEDERDDEVFVGFSSFVRYLTDWIEVEV